MQVGLVTGKQTVDLVEMPDPEPSDGKAVVEISYCGICGTDLHAYQSGAPYNPAICGHEWVGHVSASHASTPNVKEGDRVAIGVASSCGQCSSCLRGLTDFCEVAFAGAIGVGPLAAPHGGFASAIAFDASRLYHVPPTVTDEAAGLLEPATVAVHAVRRTPLNVGENAVVIGAGPIGLLVLQAAIVNGVGPVVVVEPQASRAQMALDMGAHAVIDPNATDNLGEAINAALGTTGADIVFECAGIAPTIQTSVDLVRRGGTVSLVGVPNGQATIDPNVWLVKELTLKSSIAYLHEDFEITKDLVARGLLNTEPLHTSTVGLTGLQDAFDRLSSEPSEVKILVNPRL